MHTTIGDRPDRDASNRRGQGSLPISRILPNSSGNPRRSRDVDGLKLLGIMSRLINIYALIFLMEHVFFASRTILARAFLAEHVRWPFRQEKDAGYRNERQRSLVSEYTQNVTPQQPLQAQARIMSMSIDSNYVQ